jgi:hypothetical protein
MIIEKNGNRSDRCADDAVYFIIFCSKKIPKEKVLFFLVILPPSPLASERTDGLVLPGVASCEAWDPGIHHSIKLKS